MKCLENGATEYHWIHSEENSCEDLPLLMIWKKNPKPPNNKQVRKLFKFYFWSFLCRPESCCSVWLFSFVSALIRQECTIHTEVHHCCVVWVLLCRADAQNVYVLFKENQTVKILKQLEESKSSPVLKVASRLTRQKKKRCLERSA